LPADDQPEGDQHGEQEEHRQAGRLGVEGLRDRATITGRRIRASVLR
jgi:hypothetical protein